MQYRTVVDAFHGEESRLRAVTIRNLDSGETRVVHPAAAFIFTGQQPNSGFARSLVEMDSGGFILTGHDLVHAPGFKADRELFAFETSAPGIFAAGDVRHGSIKQVASAVGEGAAAAIAIREFLKTA